MRGVIRERLPNRRLSITWDLDVGQLRYTATVGFYENGHIGEIFIDGRKIGSAADAAARDAAITASIALQFGADIETIRKALCRDACGKAVGPLGAALDMLSKEGTQ